MQELLYTLAIYSMQAHADAGASLACMHERSVAGMCNFGCCLLFLHLALS